MQLTSAAGTPDSISESEVQFFPLALVKNKVPDPPFGTLKVKVDPHVLTSMASATQRSIAAIDAVNNDFGIRHTVGESQRGTQYEKQSYRTEARNFH